MDASIYISVGAVLVSAGTLFIALRKAQHETEHLDSQSDKIRVEARNIQDQRILNLEKKITAFQMRLNKQDTRIKILEKENAALREWAENLCEQVSYLGGKPVELGE